MDAINSSHTKLKLLALVDPKDVTEDVVAYTVDVLLIVDRDVPVPLLVLNVVVLLVLNTVTLDVIVLVLKEVT